MKRIAARSISLVLFAVAFASVSTASFWAMQRVKVPAELLRKE